MDIHAYLTFKKEDEEGPDIKGGHVDALIVHATKVQKISEGEERVIYYIFIFQLSHIDFNCYYCFLLF